MLDLLSFIFQVLTNKLSDLIFFIEDFFFLGDVATKRIRLTKKVARQKGYHVRALYEPGSI
jgi:hypothetical protein